MVARWSFVSSILFLSPLASRAAHADEPVIAPPMYLHGNLRVALTCAGRLVTPAEGLRVTIVGMTAPLKPLRVNSVSQSTIDENGAPMVTIAVTDVGYLAPPGLQRVRVEAPDCAAEEHDVDVSPSHAMNVEGTMRVVNREMLGTAAAPDGFTLLLAAFTASVPRTVTRHDDWALADPRVAGGLLSFGGEVRSLVFMVDQWFGYGSVDGATIPKKLGVAPAAVRGWLFEMGLTMRLGARLAMHDVALSGGGGIGGALWTGHLESDGPGPFDAMRANRPSGSWHVPLWAAVTIKPGCDWGLQLMATYAAVPTQLDASSTSLAAGLSFQPSHACSDVPGVSVAP